MKLSEKYLQLHISTEIPEGETWSAYEYETVDLKYVRKYGNICVLETMVEYGNYMAQQSAIKELNKIAKDEKIEYEM